MDAGNLRDVNRVRAESTKLVRIGIYPEILQITQLRNKLPAEAVAPITGLCQVELVWSTLN
jgi:hypothetical protein